MANTTTQMREIYLFIVTLRENQKSQTYPVMFVMIFDSISIEGTLKRCTKPLHSCLKFGMIGETTGNLDAPSRQFVILCAWLFFLFDQVKLQRFNGFRVVFVCGIRRIFLSVTGFHLVLVLLLLLLLFRGEYIQHFPQSKFLSTLLNFLMISCNMHVQCDFIILFTNPPEITFVSQT